MKWTMPEREKRPYFIAAITLLVGWGAALATYVTADAGVQEGPWELTADSRKYVRNLEMYGGKGNVLAVEILNWFNGLWQGRTLAFTVAAITLIVSLCYLLIALRLLATENDGSD